MPSTKRTTTKKRSAKKAQPKKKAPTKKKVARKRTAKSQSAGIAMPVALKESEWDRLLRDIAVGNVVPVLGGGLLRYDADDPSSDGPCFYRDLSFRLLKRWKLDADLGNRVGRAALQEAVSRYYEEGKQDGDGESELRLNDAYQHIEEEARKMKFRFPPMIDQLASIRGFRTYLTTNFNDKLETALKKAGREATIGSFWPNHAKKVRSSLNSKMPDEMIDDLDSELLDDDFQNAETDRNACQVFHLLGTSKVKKPHTFAIWDNDLLNWIMELNDGCPEIVGQCFEGKNLLFLGLQCENWLARFLLRIANRGPLEEVANRNYFADWTTPKDTLIFQFIRTLGPSRISAVELATGGLELFIHELSERWAAYELQGGLPSQNQEHPKFVPPKKTPPLGDFIFISYSRKKDLVVAKAIKQQLDSLGIPAWFDLEQTGSGSSWELEMTDAISRCTAFLPIISKECLAEKKGYYFTEWQIAAKIPLAPATKFFFPVLLKTTKSKHMNVPEKIQKITHTRLPDGLPDKDFSEKIQAFWGEVTT